MEVTELQEFRETAILARVPVDEREEQTLYPAFSQMVSLFAFMRQADTADIAAVNSQADFVTASAAVSVTLVGSDYLRPDASPEKTPEDLTEFMLSQSGERDGNFVVIPNVL